MAFTLAATMGILNAEQKDLLILIVTLSMALTPLVLRLVTVCLPPAGLSEAELKSLEPPEEAHDIIIAGFGRFGQIMGRILNAHGIHYTAIDKNPEQVQLVRRFGNQVYFGDVSRQSLLDKAHAGQAKLLALCIDDVEASIAAVQLLKLHYPGLRIFARARNRFHEIRLRELQVEYVVRETLHSALEFTSEILKGLGMSAERARHSVATFQEQDKKLLDQQTAIINDQSSLVQSTQDAATELMNLLQQDSGRQE